MPIRVLKKAVFAFFLILLLGLGYMQIIKGSYYFRVSQNNRIKLIRLSAPRGAICDARGTVLTGVRACFNAAVLSQEVKDVQKTIRKISTILGVSPERLWREYKRNFLTPFSATVIARDIPKEKAIALECKESQIPGLVIQTEALRDYPYGESLCHILGYLGRATEEESQRLKQYGLQVRDLVGKSGIEESLEHYLRGQSGGMQVEVNNRGHLVRVLGKQLPQRGTDIYLTIDAQLQKFVDGLLATERGVCIVLDPQTGEIKSLVSKPSFNPNLFIDALNEKPEASGKIAKLLNSQQAPLLNRAISGTYSPGSIFKIVVAAAGLETGKLTLQDTVVCSGMLTIGNRDFLCWNLDGHGSQNIYSGLAHSCNVFFYKLGLSLGADRLALFAHKFGLGAPADIELPFESKGLVPSPTWKLMTKKERWYDGETANFSIGQGYLLTTPLQIAQMVSAIANGGYLIQPRLVKRVGEQELLGWRKKIGLKKKTIEIIKEGMRRVVQEPDGTGHRAYIAGVEWAAKTGTTQTAMGTPHGWFAGFYPLEDPQIVVLVFLEYGGSGGEGPAAIAKQIIEYIRQKDKDSYVCTEKLEEF